MEAASGNVKGHVWLFVCFLAVCLLLAGCARETKNVEEVPQELSEVQQAQELPEAQQGQASETEPVQALGFEEYVVWALPGNYATATISEETLLKINRKLATGGYPFGLKILYIDNKDYMEHLKESGADIVSLGLNGLDEERGELAMEMGLLECLDERLAGSLLYDAIPDLCWESVRGRDGIYCIPCEALQDPTLNLWVRTEHTPGGLPEEFSGDVLALEPYLSEHFQLIYGPIGLRFADIFGYVYDPANGLLFTEDGSCIDPLGEPCIVEWLRTMNRWYQEGRLQIDNGYVDECGMSLSVNHAVYQDGRWREYAVWKGHAFHRTNCSTGILASSDRKDAAFRLLELFHTDHSYGNLLVFGEEDPDSAAEQDYSVSRLVLGLDTGLARDASNSFRYFASEEEKKRYYEENILPSPSLYLEIPEECRKVVEIEDKYLRQTASWSGNRVHGEDLITCVDFEEQLRRFRDELRGPMEEVLRKLAEQ